MSCWSCSPSRTAGTSRTQPAAISPTSADRSCMPPMAASRGIRTNSPSSARAAVPADGQPQPVAPVAAVRQGRPVQGGRAHVPGAQPRHLQPHHRRGRHRPDPVRSADLHRVLQGGTRAVLRASAPQAGPGGRVLAQPRRPLRRGEGRDRGGGRRGRKGPRDRPRGLPRGGRLGEHHGRQRDDPPRALPVRLAGPVR